MTKVLVTGASGFVGSHVAKALAAQGDEVTCLVRRSSAVERLNALGVRLAQADVTDPDSLPSVVADAEVVYHVAGCTAAFRAGQYDQINHQGTWNLLEACAARISSPVVVIVSSLAAAGPTIDGQFRVESDPPSQVSHYGRSKRNGELAAEQFADRVPITIVRPPIVLGEGDRVGLAMFTMISRLGVFVVPSLGRSRYSIIHAEDLARLLIQAAEHGERLPTLSPEENPTSQGYYFGACDEHPSYAELGRMIATAMGHRPPLIIPTPPRAVWVVAAFGELKSKVCRRPEYLTLDRAGEIRAGSWLCSPQKAVNGLGFSVAATLAQRLKQTVAWYREHGWLR